MPKSYLNGAANRSAREERAKQIAKMPKMSAFLKPADSAPLPMTTESAYSRNQLSSAQRRRWLWKLALNRIVLRKPLTTVTEVRYNMRIILS